MEVVSCCCCTRLRVVTAAEKTAAEADISQHQHQPVSSLSSAQNIVSQLSNIKILTFLNFFPASSGGRDFTTEDDQQFATKQLTGR